MTGEFRLPDAVTVARIARIERLIADGAYASAYKLLDELQDSIPKSRERPALRVLPDGPGDAA